MAGAPGVEIGGHHVLALRLPFLAIGALLPLLVVRTATRWFGNVAGWQAGSLTLLMPLSATLGLLAVPDVPMALAAVICLHAGARMLHNVDASSAMKLALGLSIGALSHYRFIGVIGVGFIALLALPQGRRMLADPRVWVALAVGVLAWLPLLAWNADNHDAGLKFQVVERHPWTFEWNGLWFLVIQPMLVTPILCMAMWKVAVAGTRRGGGTRVQWRYFGLVGAYPRWASSCWASSPTSSGSVSIGHCRATWPCWWRCRWCSTAGHAGCGAPAGGWQAQAWCWRSAIT